MSKARTRSLRHKRKMSKSKKKALKWLNFVSANQKPGANDRPSK